MKADIHPKYLKAHVTCACGNTFDTRSTRGDIKIDICAACHPFFTGAQKFVDTAGRVDKFRRRYSRTSPETLSPEMQSPETLSPENLSPETQA